MSSSLPPSIRHLLLHEDPSTGEIVHRNHDRKNDNDSSHPRTSHLPYFEWVDRISQDSSSGVSPTRRTNASSDTRCVFGELRGRALSHHFRQPVIDDIVLPCPQLCHTGATQAEATASAPIPRSYQKHLQCVIRPFQAACPSSMALPECPRGRPDSFRDRHAQPWTVNVSGRAGHTAPTLPHGRPVASKRCDGNFRREPGFSPPPPRTNITSFAQSTSRASRACDRCRLHKVRCQTVHTRDSEASTCGRCMQGGTECSFFVSRKKRGPIPRVRI